MTSVLYGAGLNYQANNPVRVEINKLSAAVSDIRKVIDSMGSEFLKLQSVVSSFDSRIAALEQGGVSSSVDTSAISGRVDEVDRKINETKSIVLTNAASSAEFMNNELGKLKGLFASVVLQVADLDRKVNAAAAASQSS